MSLSLKKNNSQNSTENDIKTTIKKSPKIKKKFLCTICEKSFSTNGNLKNHINTIHNHILPFKCPYLLCKNSYSNQSRLLIHIRTHSGFKPYICPICKKSFNEKGNLKTHIGFHSNERPYKCNYCDKSYKTNGHLKDHIETHHFNLKKFVCNICQSKFGRRSTLSSHMRTHYGNVIFHSFKNVNCDEKINDNEKNNNENGNVCFNDNLYQKLLDLNENKVEEFNVSDSNELSTEDKNILIPCPNDKAANEAIIPPKGLRLPYLNRSAPIGNIITKPISPSNENNKLINISKNVNVFFLACFVSNVKLVFKNPVFSKTPIPINTIINNDKGVKLTKLSTA